jgi:hypothetical protein
MALMIIINHFAGIILLISLSGSGILERCNIKPDKMITVSINLIREIIIAVCCELEMVEISIPSESAVIVKRIFSKASKNILPSIGMLKTNTPRTTITVALII